MARLPLKNQEDLPEEYQYLLGEDVLGERNIFRAMGNNPPILKSYMLYGSTLWNECGLSPHDRELVILGIARALDSRYEWQQHYDIGRGEGVTVEEMRAIGTGALDFFSDDVRAAIEYAGAFARGEVTDDLHGALAEQYDDRTVAGIGMLASHYVATARLLHAFGVPLEDEFVGWEPR